MAGHGVNGDGGGSKWSNNGGKRWMWCHQLHDTPPACQDFLNVQMPSTLGILALTFKAAGPVQIFGCSNVLCICFTSTWSSAIYEIAELHQLGCCLLALVNVVPGFISNQHSLVQILKAVWITWSFLRDRCSLLLQNFRNILVVCSSSPCCEELGMPLTKFPEIFCPSTDFLDGVLLLCCEQKDCVFPKTFRYDWCSRNHVWISNSIILASVLKNIKHRCRDILLTNKCFPN